MVLKLINSVFLILFTISSVNAETIEIFLNKEDKEKIENLDAAKEKNISIVFYYLDEKERLENIISEAVKNEFNKAFDQIKRTNSEDSLREITEDELAKMVFLQYQKMFGNKHKQIIDSLMTEKYLADINIAANDIEYAKKHTIELNDLPAMVYKNRVLKRSYDIEGILK